MERWQLHRRMAFAIMLKVGTEPKRLVLGMMPHPENHVTERQGRAMVTAQKRGHALPLFRNGVLAARAS